MSTNPLKGENRGILKNGDYVDIKRNDNLDGMAGLQGYINIELN